MVDIMDEKTLKKLHKTEIEILDEVVRICEKNNLQYFLVEGTLLGAVRHKGFIPWDDDMDIAMTRKDYNKFLEIAEKELHSDYLIDNIYNNPKYYLTFTKIRKKNTIFEQNYQTYYDGPKGIWIDIFPLDEAKRNNSILIVMQKKIGNILRRLLAYKSGIIEGKYKKVKRFIGKLVFLSNKKLIKIIDFIFQLQNNKKNNTCIINFSSAYNLKKELSEKINYFPAKKMIFEGKEYSVPNNYKKVLTNIYGDYMKLPPKNERVTHNPVKIKF